VLPCALAQRLVKECEHVKTLRTAVAVKKYFQETGIKKCMFPLHPRLLPGCDFTKMVGQDVMHDEDGGTIPHDGAIDIRAWIKKKYFTFQELEAQLAQVKKSNPACTIPKFNPCILKKGKTLRMKCAQAHDYMTYSKALFLPLLKDMADTDPNWRAWRIHIKYHKLMLQPKFTRAEVAKLDTLIKKHQRKCDATLPPPLALSCLPHLSPPRLPLSGTSGRLVPPSSPSTTS